MKNYYRTKTTIVWQNSDGTYYSRNRNKHEVKSPIDATDYTAYHHEAIQDLQESMTCSGPGRYPGKWVKVTTKLIATTLAHNEH